jgi:hypothetical protein
MVDEYQATVAEGRIGGKEISKIMAGTPYLIIFNEKLTSLSS